MRGRHKEPKSSKGSARNKRTEQHREQVETREGEGAGEGQRGAQWLCSVDWQQNWRLLEAGAGSTFRCLCKAGATSSKGPAAVLPGSLAAPSEGPAGAAATAAVDGSSGRGMFSAAWLWMRGPTHLAGTCR